MEKENNEQENLRFQRLLVSGQCAFCQGSFDTLDEERNTGHRWRRLAEEDYMGGSKPQEGTDDMFEAIKISPTRKCRGADGVGIGLGLIADARWLA